MNLFPEQFSAAGARQLDAQFKLFRSATGSAFEQAEKLMALQFETTRGAIEKSSALLRQVAAAKDPRDLIALASQTQSQLDSVLAYQRKLLGIAMSTSVPGLTGAVTPTASAALEKLAALPPVAHDIIEETNAVVEELADTVEEQADATATVADSAADDIIEQTNAVVEAFADAPTAEPVAIEAAPIAELTPVAAAANHQQPQPSAAPFTVASSDTPIEVSQVEPSEIAPLEASPPPAAPAQGPKQGTRGRKK